MRIRLQRCALIVIATMIAMLTAAGSASAFNSTQFGQDAFADKGTYGATMAYNPRLSGRWVVVSSYSCVDLYSQCRTTEWSNTAPAYWYNPRYGWEQSYLSPGEQVYLYQAYNGYWLAYQQDYGWYYVRWDYLVY